MKPTTKNITLPKPLEHQQPILADPARFKLLACGRRWGKTILSLIAMILGHGPDRMRRGALSGGNVWYIAPNFGMAVDTWRLLKRTLGYVAAEKTEQSDAARPSGWRSNHDQIRGQSGLASRAGLDGAVLDEAAFLDPRVWYEAIRPALADRLGWAILISTPQGHNWFYRQFRDAQIR